MQELGYQAGQHEILADDLQQRYSHEIKGTIKETIKMVEQIKKNLKSQQMELEKSYKTMEKYKNKYFKCQEDFDSFHDSPKIYNAFSENAIRKVLVTLSVL